MGAPVLFETPVLNFKNQAGTKYTAAPEQLVVCRALLPPPSLVLMVATLEELLELVVKLLLLGT